MPSQTLEEQYVDELRDLYSAEQQILNALPKMEHAASHSALKQVFTDQVEQARAHVRRLESIFDQMGQPAQGKKCVVIAGLLEEGGELLEEKTAPTVRDAGLIAAAHRVEHYEMAVYGTVRNYAHQLGHNDAARALWQTMLEVGETDHQLTAAAKQVVDPTAGLGPGGTGKGY